MNQYEVIEGFETLSKEEKLVVARKIQMQMADELFEELDALLPDVPISEDEIQQEIDAYRNERRKQV
ncbi:hypothetical protein SAMN05216327_10743 [Dyadobacter sp. SG02]|uniref:hypothetical protein n=1 Tax=Dyadobacter sp. SG02 TaxID=1855291 RepID=UPI0008D3624E|nr:hypothetical protein [Dyadobacter sp. SG02]SEJ19858.1 hypothetical protein SAMN05216327_10743 [Dyadobacter sp. SG02]